MAQLNIAIAIAAKDDASGPLGTITKALGGLADIAGGALSFALGGVLKDAFDAAAGAMGDFFAAALDAEKTQTSLAALIHSVNSSAVESAAKLVAAQTVTTTSTVMSGDKLEKLQDQIAHATAKLDDMTAAYPKLKHPTEVQTLALTEQRKKLDELTASLAAGSVVITSTGGALEGMASSGTFSIDVVNQLALQFRDLVGGSKEAALGIEAIGIRSGAISQDQMPKFIQTVADLAAVTGDASSAATMLARAQEDPVAAMGKLQRAGILFDISLKEQIKDMVKHGDAAGATALIMERVATATGGQAAAAMDTLSGQWEILTNHLETAGTDIALKLLPPIETLFDQYIAPNIPVVEAFASAIGDQLGKAIDYISGSFQNFPTNIIGAIGDLLYHLAGTTNINALNTLGDIINGLPADFAALQDAVKPVLDLFARTWGGIRDILTNFWTNNALPVLTTLSSWLKVIIPAALQILSDFWSQHVATVWTNAVTVYRNIKTALALKVDELKTAITLKLDEIKGWWATHGADIWTGIVSKYTAIKTDLSTKMQEVKVFVTGKLDEIKQWWATHGATILQSITNTYDTIKTSLFKGMLDIKAAVTLNLDEIKQAWLDHNLQVRLDVASSYQTIHDIILAKLTELSGTVQSQLALIQGWWQAHLGSVLIIIQANWTVMTTVFKIALAGIYLLVQVVLGNIQDFWKAWGPLIEKMWSDFWGHLGTLLDIAADLLSGNWKKLWDDLGTYIGQAVGIIGDFLNGLVHGAIQGFLDAVGRVRDALAWFSSQHVPSLPTMPNPTPYTSPSGGGLPAQTVPGGFGAVGLDMWVPSGFPNDSGLVHVSSGEHVRVTPAGQQDKSGNTYNYYVNASYPMQDKRTLAQDLRLMSRLRTA